MARRASSAKKNTKVDLNLYSAALDDFARGPLTQQLLRVAGDDVRDRARVNARPISAALADALWTDDPAEDAEGAYVDVGYNKTRPGWVLWFHEVGTFDVPATPHLRPAAGTPL